jgi:hypothetical protein
MYGCSVVGKKMYSLIFLLIYSLKGIYVSPILVTDVVGKISSVITTPTGSFEWLIQPNVQLDCVVFVFNSISINTAQLTIYDTTIESPLFSCAACGLLLPPVFTSKTGAVRVKFQGVSGTSFTSSSFTLQYVGQVSNGETFRSEYFNFKLNLFMGYGQLQPPLVGGQVLPKFANMSWLIRVNAPTITFSISKFDFPVNTNATLMIYDGISTLQPILFNGKTASQPPDYWLSTSSSMALIVLSNTGNDALIQLQVDFIADMELYRCGSLGIPDTLVSNSMRIVDGSKSSNFLRRGANCEWLITPIKKGPINLLLRWVSLRPGAIVTVYDSPDKSGYVLWNSVNSFAIVPPPILSTGNSLYITYTSNTLLASSFLGFQGDYYTAYSLTPGTGTRQEFYSMSSALGIRLPDRLSTITQPKYVSSFEYSYLIQPQSSSSAITLFFNSLNFPNCGDRLEIYDGKVIDANKLLGIFCSATTPYKWLLAPSGLMLLRFIANADDSRNASFDLSYFSDGPNYHCGFTTNPAILRATSMFITDGSQSSEAIYSNQYCEWIISPNGDNHGLFLYFDRLDISTGGEITIYDGTEYDASILIQITGATVVPVPVFTSQSPNVRIVFSTSSTIGIGTGFSLTYFSMNYLHTGPGDDVIKIYSSSYSSLTLPQDIHTQQFISSNYTWHINPANTGDDEPLYLLIQIAHIVDCLESIRISKGNPRSKGPLILNFSCHSEMFPTYRLGSWIKVTGGEMVIDFISMAPPSSLSSTTESNFNLAYFTKGGESFQCGIARNPLELSLSSYFISDGSKAGDSMHLGEVCEWRIEIPEKTFIIFEMLSIDLRGGGQLSIFDGLSETSTILWSCFDCTNLPPLLFTSKNQLFIRYQSPTTTTSAKQIGLGFQGLYWSLSKEATDDLNSSPSDSLLLLPTGISFSPTVPRYLNETIAWNLQLSEDYTTLTSYPSYQSSPPLTNFIIEDGRNSATMTELFRGKQQQFSCGILEGMSANLQSLLSISLSSSQTSSMYVSYKNQSEKMISQLTGVWTNENKGNGNDDLITTPDSCVYILDSDESIPRSITLNIEQFVSQSTGHLRVYGGVTGTDRLLVDLFQSRMKTMKLQLPCGKGMIIIDSNSSTTGTNPPTNMTTVDYGFRISYALNKFDNGKACKKYSTPLLFPYLSSYPPFLSFLLFPSLLSPPLPLPPIL